MKSMNYIAYIIAILLGFYFIIKGDRMEGVIWLIAGQMCWFTIKINEILDLLKQKKENCDETSERTQSG